MKPEIDRRFSPNLSSHAIDVFPIPPSPMRAIGSRFSASPTAFSINRSRPKKALGAGGGDSPGGTLVRTALAEPRIA